MPSSDSKKSSKKRKKSSSGSRSKRDTFNRWMRRRSAEISPGLKVIWSVLIFPIRLLLFPFNKKSLSLFHNTGVETSGLGTKRRGKFFKWLVWIPFQIVVAPFPLIRPFFKKTNRRDLVFIAPAASMIVFLTFVCSYAFIRADTIKGRYRKGAKVAFLKGDFDLAKTYYQRILLEEKLPADQTFCWAMVLARTGEGTRATELIDELAPDMQIGLGAAHRVKALYLFKELKNSSPKQAKDPELLQKLKWHLEQTTDKSPEISEAWATYYMATGNVAVAIKHLNDSAKINPMHYIVVSELHKGLGDAISQKHALEQAEKSFRKQLDKNQFDHRPRVTLANVLTRQGNIDEAKQVLVTGVRLRPNSFIKQASADFLTMQHDRARKANKDAGEQLEFLIEALKLDPNHGKVLNFVP